MPCFHPLAAYYDGETLKLSRSDLDGLDGGIRVPCGKCLGCQKEKQRQWAVRMMHELQASDDVGSFLTLTYDDEHLPEDWHVDVEELKRFFKRARRRGLSFRYFACGEYGDSSSRPHYHVAMFGEDFARDRYSWSESGSQQLFRSPTLEALWPYGQALVGNLEWASCLYVAKYIQKKLDGDTTRYDRVDKNGAVYQLKPEFAVMSRDPGIGHDWFVKYWRDVYPGDQVVVNGHPAKPPRYYDTLLERYHPLVYDQVKAQRANTERDPHEQTRQRLHSRDRVRRRTTENRRRDTGPAQL